MRIILLQIPCIGNKSVLNYIDAKFQIGEVYA
jgi:hypothetical protein